jgi:hypothetical protein
MAARRVAEVRITGADSHAARLDIVGDAEDDGHETNDKRNLTMCINDKSVMSM